MGLDAVGLLNPFHHAEGTWAQLPRVTKDAGDKLKLVGWVAIKYDGFSHVRHALVLLILSIIGSSELRDISVIGSAMLVSLDSLADA